MSVKKNSYNFFFFCLNEIFSKWSNKNYIAPVFQKNLFFFFKFLLFYLMYFLFFQFYFIKFLVHPLNFSYKGLLNYYTFFFPIYYFTFFFKKCIKKISVLKSPFVYKSSWEQFELRKYKKFFILKLGKFSLYHDILFFSLFFYFHHIVAKNLFFSSSLHSFFFFLKKKKK